MTQRACKSSRVVKALHNASRHEPAGEAVSSPHSLKALRHHPSGVNSGLHQVLAPTEPLNVTDKHWLASENFTISINLNS
jgi:hypothetical protein